MRSKFNLIKSSIIITAVISMFLIAGNTIAAQPGDILNNSNIISLLESDAVFSEADDSATCILATVISSISELSECGDDSACRASATFEMVVDILLCANPDDSNIIYVSCLADALIDMIQVSSTCNGDKACVMQSMIPLVVKLMNCKPE